MNMRPNFAPNVMPLYRAKLAAHDWSFEFSDDPHAYRKGQIELAELLVLQRDIDPDKVVWNELKPPLHRG